ncbi:MAG: bifunctional diguanylate cyclase/phosphodiesterase, partial [Actinobacteria bacterium]|nr:bifunctional diguanylate cyclase/phosphodiesterase [Actinomycetota bacterium]
MARPVARVADMRSGTRHLLSVDRRPPGGATVLAAIAATVALVVAVIHASVPTGLAAAAVASIAWCVTLLLLRRLDAARAMALRDPLTGLPNRVLLDDRIDQAIARAQRTGESFSLLVIDLDGFKEVNDVRGHEAGDQVLVATAARLEEVVRASDTVARIGGDEFVVLSLGAATEEEAATLIARIRSELRAPFVVGDGVAEIDASVGVAIFPTDGGSPAELLGHADAKMFQSKRGALEPGTQRVRGNLDVGIVRELEAALENGELVVHFQPIISVATGAPVAAEALVRRVHPERGLVTPAEFLPHVERTAVMRELTLHVLDRAFRELARWRTLGHPIGAYVNVPMRLL